MAAPTTPDTFSIKPAIRQKWLPPGLLMVALASQLPNVLRHSADPSINQLDATWRHDWLLTFAPLYAIILVVLLLPVRVELGESTLVLHRPLRRRPKFHLVGQTWLARRGDEWVELPPPRPGWLRAEP